MEQESFLDKLRSLVGSVTFSIFLWSIKMTPNEYVDTIVRENRTQNEQPIYEEIS